MPRIMVDGDEATSVNGQRLWAPHVPVQSVADPAHSEALALMEHLCRPRKLTYVLSSSLIGHRDSPGLGHAVPLTPTLGRASWRRWRAAARAQREAPSAAVAKS